MPMSSAGRTRQAGITLIEMMVVVSVIGLMVAISAPSLGAGIDSVRMTSATNSVANFLNSAVNRAERKQIAIEVVISPKKGTFTMYSNEPGFERVLKLPDGIVIEAIEPAVEEPEFRLILMPGTAAPGIGIKLANSHGNRRIVRLDPMTGFPRVERVQEKP
jgi:prepilin-type N-terminal cleavage/methylation domain-containing protein